MAADAADYNDDNDNNDNNTIIIAIIYGALRGRQWHPTPVFLPGESQGPGSLVGCHLWGRTESDTIEVT